MQIHTAFSPMAITLTLNDEVDISRGDMLVKSEVLPQVADALEVMLVWMNESAMQSNQDYLIKSATNLVTGRFSQIHHTVDVNTLEQRPAQQLALNEIARCTLQLNSKIAFDPYQQVKGTGSFIVIDKYTNATLAAGMMMQAAHVEDKPERRYSEAEKALNAYVRTHYPEWGCAPIDTSV
jgi:sulfate adenylyltransferase subunit 1